MDELTHGRTFASLVTAATERGLRLVLFGGFALPLYGVEPSALDIDLLLCDQDLPAFSELAAERGYAEALRTAQYAKSRHLLPEILDIDTVFVDRGTIDRIWADGEEQTVFGTRLRCASLDMMLGTKLHAIRYSEANRGPRDFGDVVELLAANAIDPGGERFRQLCARYGTDEILE